MADLIGQSLGRYHILEQLGEGGMAVVYKAFDTRLERNVAIKVILPSKEHSEKFLKRFEREAKSLAQLSHPNIVKVIDYGEHEGLPYLVMEYLPGGTLKQKLAGKPMPWQEAARILTPIARALAYAHESRIVHRDIKPSNILITQSGEPMLSDFGIAKLLEADETLDLTGTGVGVGTPEYMSPEQAQGQMVDARSDVYSLGVVFYEMVTGRKPYQADTPYAVVIKHVNEPLPRPKYFAKDLPDVVEQILLKALAKKPSDRFEDMSALARILEKALLGSGTQISFGRFGVGRRLYVSLGLLGFLGLAIVIVWITTGNKWIKVNPTVIPPPAPTSDPTLYDNFNDPIFDGKVNADLWQPIAVSPDRVTQQDGILTITNESNAEDVASLIRISTLRQTKLDFVETRLRLSSERIGSEGDISFQLATTLNNGKNLIFWCGVYRSTPLQVGCEVYGRTNQAEYLSERKITDYDAWHTVRIEVNKDLQAKFYVDDQQVGSYQPADAGQIADRNFMLRLETWSPSKDGIQAQFDYVRIGQSE